MANRYILTVTLVIIIWASWGCQKNQQKVDQLETQTKVLIVEKVRKDSMLHEFMTAFNQFEENLERIKERENIITLTSDERGYSIADKKAKINHDLQLINELLIENRAIIDQLTAQLGNSNVNTQPFQEALSRLKGQLENKDQNIRVLTDQLITKDFEIESLSQQNTELVAARESLYYHSADQAFRISNQLAYIAQQDEKIHYQAEEMSSIHYVVGDKTELRAYNIIDKRREINPNLPTHMFTEMNMMDLNYIPLEAKRVEVVSIHPSESYQLKEDNGQIVSLEILDPETFWQATRYLIIMTK